NGYPPLVTIADRASEERLRLRIATGAAKLKVFFSYPRVEVALTRARVPSFYALDVRRTTIGSLPNVEEFERGAALNSGAELAWLAPEDRRAAIDEIEYDLSVLRPLLSADPNKVRGGARFLLELSDDLGRSLRSRWQRWQKNWGTADGLFDSKPSIKAHLASYLLTTRAYSPTALQSFSICPYKFLLSAIHRLAPREDSVPLEILDPMTKGQIFHSVIARFLRYAMANNMLPLGNDAALGDAQAVLYQILSATAT